MSSVSGTERKRRLDYAVQQVLKNNFDADSKVCFITIMKMIDNLLSKPDNEQVRSIRLGNPAFNSKVVQKQGHLILLAVGFVVETQEEERLVLRPDQEDTQVLVQTRRTIHTILVHELKCKADSLPAEPQARQRVEVRTTTHPSGHTTTTTSNGFDVYRGQRFDGQSAAVGTNLGPPAGWKSTTEQQLEQLQSRQKKLEEKEQRAGSGSDRQWQLVLPGQQLTSQQASIVSSVSSTITGGGRGGGTGGPSDSSLLAQHYKDQAAKRVEAENRGFTTKAMRDLEKIKKQKVYSHTVLAITFPDSVVVKAAFRPRETVQTVMNELRQVVLTAEVDFELYQTPPRTLLKPTATLFDLGLVPAAKVHVSWKKKVSNNGKSDVGSYLRPDFVQQQKQASSVAMPTATAVAGTENTKKKSEPDGTANTGAAGGIAKKKKTKADKEKEMLARMMGK